MRVVATHTKDRDREVATTLRNCGSRKVAYKSPAAGGMLKGSLCRGRSGFAEWRHPTRRSHCHGREQRIRFNLVSNTGVQGPVSTSFDTLSLVGTDTVVLNTKGDRNRSSLSTNRIKGQNLIHGL